MGYCFAGKIVYVRPDIKYIDRTHKNNFPTDWNRYPTGIQSSIWQEQIVKVRRVRRGETTPHRTYIPTNTVYVGVSDCRQCLLNPGKLPTQSRHGGTSPVTLRSPQPLQPPQTWLFHHWDIACSYSTTDATLLNFYNDAKSGGWRWKIKRSFQLIWGWLPESFCLDLKALGVLLSSKESRCVST